MHFDLTIACWMANRFGEATTTEKNKQKKHQENMVGTLVYLLLGSIVLLSAYNPKDIQPYRIN